MKVKSGSEVAQSCLTLCDPMDCSLPGFSIHVIFQARYWSGLPLASPIFMAIAIKTPKAFFHRNRILRNPKICMESPKTPNS